MPVSNLLRNVEAETVPKISLCAVKRLKEMNLLGFGHSNSIISYDDLNFVLQLLSPETNVTTELNRIDSVRNQVGQDLTDLSYDPPNADFSSAFNRYVDLTGCR
jgi:hypothetical protein